MSNIWNPFAFGVTGEPVAPQTNSLRVYGAEPSEAQLATAQHAFAQFCSTSRLSAVPNPMEQGWLPDGSKYRTVTVGNMRVMEVWTEAEAAVASSAAVFGGLLRMHDPVTGAGGGAYYREFKENAGPKNDPPRYVDTNKFNDPLTGGALVGGGLWGAFSATDLSGPAAKLAQFGRGALSAYAAYFRRKNIPVNHPRRIGFGVFVLTGKGGNKRAFCYTHPYYDNISRAVPMQIVSYAEFGAAKIPAEIKELFGGVPIPPLDSEFENVAHNKIISRADVRAAVGAGVGETPEYSGEMDFPVYATTGDGLDVYFIAGKSGPLPGATDPRARVSRCALMRMQISSEGEGGEPKAVLTRESTLEVSGFSGVTQRNLPVGVYRSYAGVTHYSGVLTSFMRTMHVVMWRYTSYSIKPRFSREEYEWSGGQVGTVVTAFPREEVGSVSGGYTGSCTMSRTGQRTVVNSSISYDVYSVWAQTATIAANPIMRHRGEPNLGCITTFGIEGTFLVSRSSADDNIAAGFKASDSQTLALGVLIESNYFYDGEWRKNQFPDLDPEAYSRDYTASLVHLGGSAVIFSGPGAEMEFSGQYRKLPTAIPENEWRLDPPEWNSPAQFTSLVTPREYTYGGNTLYANGVSVQYDALSILRDAETPQRYREIVDKGVYAARDPFELVSRPILEEKHTGIPLYRCAVSQLGGRQALLMAHARNPAEELMPKSFTHGTLVNNAEDKTYPSPVRPVFVGELQP